MQVRTPREVYNCIIEDLEGRGIPRNISSQDKIVSYVESALSKTSQPLPLVLVLDEIDQLASRCQDVLYRYLFKVNNNDLS